MKVISFLSGSSQCKDQIFSFQIILPAILEFQPISNVLMKTLLPRLALLMIAWPFLPSLGLDTHSSLSPHDQWQLLSTDSLILAMSLLSVLPFQFLLTLP